MRDHSTLVFPPIGFGTSWPGDVDEVGAVRTALEVGYRHLDTATLYGNESAVGEAIVTSSVDRESVFLATKIDPGNLSYDDVLDTTDASLDRLGVDAVDLLYVHWPTESYDPDETLAAFDELVDRGDVRRVGVSNFTPAQLKDAVDRLDPPLFAHQVECHPLLPQRELRELADELGHYPVAHSPLAGGEVLDHPTIRTVADDHDASPAQVCLAWHREKGVHPIPRATGEAHIADNYGSLSLSLDADSVDRIDAIDDSMRVMDFDGAPWDS